MFRLDLIGWLLVLAPWCEQTASFVRADEQTSFQCMNPLFRGHWFTQRTDSAHLGRVPIAYDNLVRCKMWNKHESCCNPSVEVSQQRAFDSRRADFERYTDLLRAYLEDLDKIKGSATYRHTDEVQQALLDRAIDGFRYTIDLAVPCKQALVLFTAGMVCFGCDPHWDDYVWRNTEGAVVAVNIAGEACIYVDQRCGDFGRAAAELEEQVMDSGLAKLPSMPLPALSMFRHRESTCKWLREDLAMQPLPGFVQPGAIAPSNMKEVPSRRLQAEAGGDWTPDADTPDVVQVTSSVLPDWALQLMPTSTSLPQGVIDAMANPTPSPVPLPPPYSTSPRHALDPIFHGKQSGFRFEVEAEAPAAPGSMYN
mmetsp:Transcript_11440/g.29546  ORF Transcript_11440/g.29546 Transcript_11440/m.29546 type:complete len:367 (-) Transcript_11440:75-1175(-)